MLDVFEWSLVLRASGDLLGGESQAPPAVSRGDATGPAQTVSSSDGRGGMFAGLDMFGGAAASAPSPPHTAAAALTQPAAAEAPASLFGGLSLAGTSAHIITLRCCFSTVLPRKIDCAGTPS